MLTYKQFSIPMKGQTITYKLSDAARVLVDQAIENLRSAGAVLSNQSDVSMMDIAPSLMKMLMMPIKLAACKPRWFDAYLKPFTGRKAFENFQQMKDSAVLPADIKEQFQRAWQIRNECDSAILSFQQGKREFTQIILRFLTTETDVLVYPTLPNFSEKFDEAQEDSITGVQLSPFTGYPTVSIPIGFSTPDEKSKQGLPLGLTFMARPNREDLLVTVAYAYQKRFGVEKVPWTLGGKVGAASQDPGKNVEVWSTPAPKDQKKGLWDQIVDSLGHIKEAFEKFWKRLTGMIKGKENDKQDN